MDWKIICYAVGVIGIGIWAIDKVVRKIAKNRKRNAYIMAQTEKKDA